MADDIVKDENGNVIEPKNNDNTQSNTSSGQDDWKAKYEAEKSAHDVTQKQLSDITQERNLHKNKATELETKLESANRAKEAAEAEATNVKADVEKAAKAVAAKTKTEELLGDFSEKTKKLVEVAGIELADAEDEDAIKAFTDKVKALDETAGPESSTPPAAKKPAPPKISSNNDRRETPPSSEKTEADEVKDLESKVSDIKF